MSEIVWQDPPATAYGTGQSGAVQRFVAALRERPGQWALYPRSMAASSSASTYRKNNPGTEWTCRRRADGKYDLYGRWVGPLSQEKTS